MNEGPKEIGYNIIEVMPEFPGGNEALSSYFKENIKLPPNWPPDSIKGKVYITFFIDTGGNVNDVKALRGINPILDSLALNAVKRMPRWSPARNRGGPLAVPFLIPVRFGSESQEKNRERK
jgi:protein TonB